ncbi:MAG: helix-turn-helix transcriptional regulator [Candidatus Cyclobacteriaceae bacterium M2_1C_046]
MQEILTGGNVNLLVVDKWLQEKKVTLEQVGQAISSIFYVSNANLNIQYLNPAAYNWLSLDPLSEMGFLHNDLRSYYHPRVSQKMLQRFSKINESHSDEEVFYDLDKVWFPETSEYELCLIATKVSKGLNSFLFSMETITQSAFIEKKISRLADEVRFVKEHESKFASLTEREKDVLLLIAKGINNPDIAEKLCISRQTVEQHRKKINKKLGTSSLLDHIKFTQAFELE